MRGKTIALRNTGLFEGIEDGEMETMLKCLGAFSRVYVKDEFLFRRGDRTDCLGVVVRGNVREVREDWWGNRTVLADHGPERTICAEYACTSGLLDVSMVATEVTEVMYLDVARVANVCSSSCEFHNRLIKNLMRNLAGASLGMNRRLDQLAKRSTREKICAFLSDQARQAGSNDFVIGMNRQEMADYLGVDRSAMSTELGKLQKEGVIEFRKNHFLLKRSEPAVPLRRELLKEGDHKVVAVVRHASCGWSVHHVSEQQELLVEVVHGRPLVPPVGVVVHTEVRPLARDVHRAAPAAAVRERPGYADGSDGVQPVRVLHYLPLQRVWGDRVRAPERDLVDYV